MKDEKHPPIWPLYLSNALAFAAILAAAFPNIIMEKPLGGGQTFALVIPVLASMALVLAFYVLQAKRQKAEEDSEKPGLEKEKTDEQFRAVFTDLRALRAKLARHSDSLERAESAIAASEKESSSQFAKLQAIDTAVEELKDLILGLSQEEAPAPENPNSNGEILSRLSELEESVREIGDDLDAFKAGFEEEDPEDSYPLPQDGEECGEPDADEGCAPSGEDEFAETSYSETMEETACANYAGENPEECATPDLSDDGDEAPLPCGEISIDDKAKAKAWEGLIDKALSNSQSAMTRGVVSRFIEKNKSGEAPATENGPESDIAEKLAEEASAPGTDAAPEGSETAEAEAPESFAHTQPALFSEDEMPQAEKPKRIKTGDTAFVANSFPGIGNRLYVRGSGGGLSNDAGEPMQMVEIGKWQWKCEALLTDEIKITIWLNDEVPSLQGEITLKPNETLEADISFQQDA